MSISKACAMKKALFPALVAMLLACAAVQGAAEDKEDFSQLGYSPTFPTGHFDFEQDPEFSMIVAELKYWIVLFRHEEDDPSIDRLKRRNHFCAVGYVFPEKPNDPDKGKGGFGRKEVIVYWKEEGEFRRWTGDDPIQAAENFYYAASLAYDVSFTLKDTVERKLWETGQVTLGTGNHIKEDVENVIADCEKHGKQYVIKPFTPPAEEYP